MGGAYKMTNYFMIVFMRYLPLFAYIVLFGIILIAVFLISGAAKENHILKHHIRELVDDETKKVYEENIKFRRIIRELKEKEEEHQRTLSGIRYVLNKGRK